MPLSPNQVLWVILWFLSIQVWSSELNKNIGPTVNLINQDDVEDEKISDNDEWTMKEVNEEIKVKINITDEEQPVFDSFKEEKEEVQDQIFRKIESPFQKLRWSQCLVIKKRLKFSDFITRIILSYLQFAPISTKLNDYFGVYDSILTRDGRWLLYGSKNMDKLFLTDTATGINVNQFSVGQKKYDFVDPHNARVPIFKNTKSIKTFAIADDHSFLVGGGEKDIWIWETMSSHVVKILTGHTASILCCRIFRNDTRIVTGSLDRTLRVWSPTKAESLLVIHAMNKIYDCAVSIDHTHIISLSNDHRMQVWNSKTGAFQCAMPVDWNLEFPKCAPGIDDPRCVGLVTGRKNIMLWDIGAGVRTKEINMASEGGARQLCYVSKDWFVWYNKKKVCISCLQEDDTVATVPVMLGDDFVISSVTVSTDNKYLIIVANEIIPSYLSHGGYERPDQITARMFTYDLTIAEQIDIKLRE